MQTLKHLLEKPTFIWLCIVVGYVAFFATIVKEKPQTEFERPTMDVIRAFADSTFPPKIDLVRNAPDWGHLGYYALMGRVDKIVASDIFQMRAVGLATVLLSFFVFIQLGKAFTYRNRLNPLWISFAMLLLAINPYSWKAAFQLGHTGFLLLSLLLSLYFFKMDQRGMAAGFVAFGSLIDVRALLLAAAFLGKRIYEALSDRGKVLRPERAIALVLPFFIGMLPFMAWRELAPEGQARQWWGQILEQFSWFRPEGFFYSQALLPIYGLFFVWAWGIRARTRALTMGAIIAALCIPFYFLFPVRGDYWAYVQNGQWLPVGLIDFGAGLVAGQYKPFLLFVPWLVGAFLFAQLILMDVLDRSRELRYFILLYFAVQPFVVDFGDEAFLIAMPFFLLLSLSEAYVGEEGKLT